MPDTPPTGGRVPWTQSDPSSLFGMVGAAMGAVVTLLVAYGVDISHAQAAAILGVAATVLPLIVTFGGTRLYAWAPTSVEERVSKATRLADKTGYSRGMRTAQADAARHTETAETAPPAEDPLRWDRLAAVLRGLADEGPERAAAVVAGAAHEPPTTWVDPADRFPDLYDDGVDIVSYDDGPIVDPLVDEVGPLAAAVAPGDEAVEAATFDRVVADLAALADRVRPLTDAELAP